MPQSRTLSLGREVHKDSIAVADVAQEHHAEGSSLGPIGPRQCDIAHLLRQMQSKSPPRVFVYAAGPCGYWLSRSRTHTGHRGGGVAPALLPQQPGERGTTTRRDAIKLARLMRSGDLPPVHGPQVADAALRDLGRAREDASRDRNAAPLRRKAFLLRQDIRYTGRAIGGPAHLRWLSEGGCPTPAQQIGATPSRPCVGQPVVRHGVPLLVVLGNLLRIRLKFCRVGTQILPHL
jgi:transposase